MKKNLPQSIPSYGDDYFLGHPISFWVNLHAQIAEKGNDFEKMFIKTLVDNEELKRTIAKLHREFKQIRNTLNKVTVDGDFILGKDQL